MSPASAECHVFVVSNQTYLRNSNLNHRCLNPIQSPCHRNCHTAIIDLCQKWKNKIIKNFYWINLKEKKMSSYLNTDLTVEDIQFDLTALNLIFVTIIGKFVGLVAVVNFVEERVIMVCHRVLQHQPHHRLPAVALHCCQNYFPMLNYCFECCKRLNQFFFVH